MKNILKRGLALSLVLIMMLGMLPITAFAAVDGTGKPTDLKNKLVLSIYTTEGTFPGEPATHSSSEYISFSSSFAQTSSSGQFKSSAESELDPSILDPGVLVQGTGNSNTKVWGVFSSDGLDQYFLPNASIIKEENELKIIKSIKGRAVEGMSDDEILDTYEIIWYVIKLQHSGGAFSFWSTTEWHIDGLIKEKQYFSVNYYGNGNTEGTAPDGTTNLRSNEDYVVLGLDASNKPMKRKIGGVEVAFLGWSARADGSDDELAFYKAGDVITAEDMANKYNGKLSLYAMWDTTTQYTATVNTYLDGVLTDEIDIHGSSRDLYLSTDKEHYYQLKRNGEGVYSAKITGNGKFYLYNKVDDDYIQIGDRQLTIYNQNGSMDIHHYSVAYDANGGSFVTKPGKQVYYYGDTVTAIADVPTRVGYRFLGWKDDQGNLILPGEEVTASITAPVTLTAQWERTVNVTVNVTINHEGGDGVDRVETKDDVVLALVSRENSSSPYLEVEGETLALSESSHEGVTFTQTEAQTKYTGYTFEEMPGGTAEYAVVTSKSGYDTEITSTKDGNGNWTIDVVMTYAPSNFDLNFTVQVDPQIVELQKTTGNEYIPDAAIVKVMFWSTDRQRWETITQQADGAPGVRVDFNANGVGSGSYPVWKYESGTDDPYLYRIEVTSFVYPDGTIVRAQTETENVVWADQVYTATMNNNVGGMAIGRSNGDFDDELYAKLDKNLDGAYYSGKNREQAGELSAVITMDLHNVTFDARGGKVNGRNEQLVENQYKIPSFKDYVPTREGGYTFGGWYLNEEYTEAGVEGTDLEKSITLYAKWIEPRTIRGKVTIAGTYDQNGEKVSVHGIDKATEAVIILQEIRNGVAVEVDSRLITFADYSEIGSATYEFAQLPNDNKEYRIQVMELNYNTGYDNESDENKDFSSSEYGAVFGTDNEAVVDAQLDFAPPSYTQRLAVDATQIGSTYRPKDVLAEVLYRDTGDNHPYQVISQHTVEPKGVQIALNNGTGTGSQSIWNWHTDGTLYDYQMNITKVDGAAYDSDSAPYYIAYSEPNNANNPDAELQAVLIPHKYQVIFDLNAGNDTVTGMDSHKLSYTDANGDVVTTDTYGVLHTWSFDTAISAVPVREGYTFAGWTTNATGVSTDSNGNATIDASVCEDVVLTAQWERIIYNVTAKVTPDGGGTVDGTGTYEYGATVTLEATAVPGYTFEGWKENGEFISNDTSLTIEALKNNREFEAEFSKNIYSVIARTDSKNGGTAVVSNNGIFDYGETATVTATVNTGYTFVGWYKGTEKVSDELSFDVTVTENLIYIAKFEAVKYTVSTNVSPAEGGETAGDGNYDYNTEVTVNATAKEGYNFVGWYENGTLISENAEFTFTVDGDRTLTAEFIRTYTVDVIVTSGGTVTGEGTYKAGETATVVATAQAGYAFLGWFEGTEKVSDRTSYSFTVESDRTLTAQFSTVYTIKTIAETGGRVSGGGAYVPMASATITATASDGYYFIGWYDEQNELVTAETSYSLTVKEDRTFTAKFAQKVSYQCDYVYIFGYTDSQIGAEGTLLRGELAQMIYRLVKQNDGVSSGSNSFSDTAGKWFESGISYMAKVGAINRNKANAYPYASVTRGETYKMICLGLGFTSDTELKYSDYAAILQNSGYLSSDGRVTAKISRWEFCALFNAILGRSNYGLVDTNDNTITHETYGYTDLDPNANYYKTMLIATSTYTDGKVDLEKRAKRNPLDEYGE